MITSVMHGNASVNLNVGEHVIVGEPGPFDNFVIEGFIYLKNDDGKKYGWVKWAYPENRVEATVDWCVPDTDPPPVDEIRSRIGRQRRELRRLNKANRELRLERDVARHALEDAVSFLIQTRKEHRTMEAMLQ